MTSKGKPRTLAAAARLWPTEPAAEKHESAAEQVKSRSAILQPGMRRAMTRPRGLDVVRDFIGWRRRIVGADDGRVIIIKSEMDAGRVPFPLHGLGVPVTILFPRRVALRTGLEGDLRWTLPARREHASQIAACFLHGPLRNRLALDAVGP